jgi:two-component system, sensor histidine kinase and response regulator
MRTNDFWVWWIGKPEEFSVEVRGLHAILAVSLVLLLAIIPINYIIGLEMVVRFILVAIFGIFGIHYLSRHLKKHTAAIVCYGVGSYGLMTFNYFANAGSIGPTIFLFFLTFQLLIAISTDKFQWVWVGLHLAIPSFLMTIEFFVPFSVPDTYNNPMSRYFDIITSYLVSVVFIYFVTHYLRTNVELEKEIALERAKEIDIKNIELERLNMEKSKLFSIISHDLRSPLASIQNYLEMLNKYPIDGEDSKRVQQQLLEQTRSTSAMMHNLLIWSKSQMQGIAIKPQQVAIDKIVDEILLVNEPIAQQKNITITYQKLTDDDAYGDPDLIKIALRNLVNNAIKFTKPGGKVEIRVTRADSMVEIAVIDNGVGISKNLASRLLTDSEISTRGTSNEKGMGLGLLLAKEYVEANGGNLDFANNPDVGATFRLRIPVYKQPELANIA